MKWTVLILLLMASNITAQINLVRNPGFEQYSICPFDIDQIHFATGWTPIDSVSEHNDSSGNPNCSADYLNECSLSFSNSVPSNYFGYQYPHSGNGMASVYMYNDIDSNKYFHYLRDYLQGRLTTKLSAGKRYCVSFYVNLEEISGYAIADIGAYLDNGSIDNTNFCGMPQTQYTPQVVNNNGIISDTANWTKIEGSFIAKGNEQFITIGNFKDRFTTTKATVPVNSLNNGITLAYYLIDDVSVIASDTRADAGPDTHVGLGDSVYIGRPNEVGLECTWSVQGSSAVIGKGAGIWVKPAVDTRYVVTQTLCGNVTRDTVLVEVWPLGLSSINGQTQDYLVVPNPGHGLVNILQNVNHDEEIQLVIFNLVGQEVYRGILSFRNGKMQVDLGNLTKGIYYLRLQNKAGAEWNKKWVKD